MGEFKQVDLDEIEISKTNPRKHFDEVKMRELKDSIIDKGVIQPVLLRPVGSNARLELVCGERRFRAAQMIPLKTIPAIIRDLTDQQALEIQIVENLQRAEIHPLEEAEGYESLLKQHDYKAVEDIAAKVGKSKTYVYQRMKLCALIPDARKMFFDGKLTASTALLVARLPEKIQKKAAEKIVNGEWNEGPMSTSAAREYIHDNFMLSLKGAPFDIKDESLVHGAGKCARCPKRTGNQADLFADLTDKSNVCTDPVCFHKKRKAQNDRKIEEAKDSGVDVLKGKKAEGMFLYGSPNNIRSGFVDVHKACPEDPKKRNYRDLLRNVWGDLPRMLVEDPAGDLRELAKYADVQKALKAAGYDFTQKKQSEGNIKEEEAEKKRKAAEMLENRIGKETASRAIVQILDAFKKAPGNFWPLFLNRIIDRVWSDCAKMVCKRHEIQCVKYSSSSGLKNAVKDMSPEELQALLLEIIIVGNDGRPWSPYDGYCDDLKAGCKQYGVDLKTIEKAVKKELSKKTAGKKPATKKAAGKTKPAAKTPVRKKAKKRIKE